MMSERACLCMSVCYHYRIDQLCTTYLTQTHNVMDVRYYMSMNAVNDMRSSQLSHMAIDIGRVLTPTTSDMKQANEL